MITMLRVLAVKLCVVKIESLQVLSYCEVQHGIYRSCFVYGFGQENMIVDISYSNINYCIL